MMYFNLGNTFLLVHIIQENFLIKVGSKRVAQYQSSETITLRPKRTHTNFIQNSISRDKESAKFICHFYIVSCSICDLLAAKINNM